MRTALIQELELAAKNDPRITLLSGDVGNRMFNTFIDAFPGRFVNAGIAEANMTGIAAGMAMAGLRPVTYAIAAFNPGRCLEQIRLDVCQHNLPVVMVGVGSGLSYASLGPTHHALEDLAWLRPIPNLAIVCPGDAWEVRAAVRAALEYNGPVYLRLGKKGEPEVHDECPDVRIGKAVKIRGGNDAAILAIGNLLPIALEAAVELEGRGIATAVYSLFSVKPLDTRLLETLFRDGGPRLVAVAEEHAAAGGGWAAVAEWLATQGATHAPLMRFGTDDAFHHEAGGQEWARRQAGLTVKNMVDRIESAMECGGTEG